MGTILPYVGDIKDIPSKWALCDGTEGTPNLLDGYFLEGNTDIKIYKEPGLPNITGHIQGVLGSPLGWYTPTGAITWNVYGPKKQAIQLGDTNQWGIIGIDASLSSTIYGKSNTVQPKGYTVFYIIKIKK